MCVCVFRRRSTLRCQISATWPRSKWYVRTHTFEPPTQSLRAKRTRIRARPACCAQTHTKVQTRMGGLVVECKQTSAGCTPSFTRTSQTCAHAHLHSTKSHQLNGHPCLLLSSRDRRFIAHSIPSLPTSPSSSPPPSLTRARAHSSASCPALALSLPPSFPPPHLCILLNSRDRPLYRPLKSPSLPPSSAALHRPQLAPHPLRQRPANVRRLILLRRRTAAPPACRRHAVRRTANRFADGPSRLTCPGCPFSGRKGHEARRCRRLCGPSKPYERLRFARVTNNN